MDRNEFNSHYDPLNEKYQSNREHLIETSELAMKRCAAGLPRSLLKVTALLHDCGKYSCKWADYFEANIRGGSGGGQDKKIDHATPGGLAAERLMGKSGAAELAAAAIYSHHGLCDAYSAEDGKFLVERRRGKSAETCAEECFQNLMRELKGELTDELLRDAVRETDELLKHIVGRAADIGEKHGSGRFWLGMYERLLVSILMDSDRRSTEDFMNGVVGDGGYDIDKIWEECSVAIKRRLEGFTDMSGINALRAEISDECFEAASSDGVRFILNVPTGAGKTLSSLRFAVEYAKIHRKRRIIYVAPYMSITEQNADEIRHAVGRDDIVLEHHSSVCIEDEDAQARYERETEDWRVPIVVTTAVQFLNTLYSGRTACVRRLGSLCDSVIIVDEVQALPINVTELFCLAVNFLTEFAGSVFVLCSATQPCFDMVEKNSLLKADEMVDSAGFAPSFIRTEIHDDTSLSPHGMDAELAAEYIAEKSREHGDVLFIANTKGCALEIFRLVSEKVGGDADVYHLSTNMYPANRRIVIAKLKERADGQRKPKICISTQVVEAGVDLSFGCVIRSLAGLDSIVQAAGRCNRHAEYEKGHVYIVRMNDETERLGSLYDIRAAQETMMYVLDQYRRFKKDGERLDSQKYVGMYFQVLYRRRQAELCYKTNVNGVSTSIVDMLSGNRALLRKSGGHLLCQAFASAGEKFNVIEDGGKFPVVVEAEDAVELLRQYESGHLKPGERKQILRKLGLYTVSISESMKNKLSAGIRMSGDKSIFILDGRYYNDRVGITETPDLMPYMSV